jgi:hypothetical protein
MSVFTSYNAWADARSENAVREDIVNALLVCLGEAFSSGLAFKREIFHKIFPYFLAALRRRGLDPHGFFQDPVSLMFPSLETALYQARKFRFCCTYGNPPNEGIAVSISPRIRARIAKDVPEFSIVENAFREDIRDLFDQMRLGYTPQELRPPEFRERMETLLKEFEKR